MTTFVTGGTGFLGLNLAEALLARGESAVLHGHVPPPPAALAAFDRLPGELHVEQGDVRDGAALAAAMRRHGATRLVHAAAVTPGPERELRDPAGILEINVVGTARALEAARAAGVGRIVAMSSGSAYGSAQAGRDRLDEELALPQPVQIYGISKYAAERTALRLAELWELDLTAVRLGPLFGRWEWATGVRDLLSPITQLSVAALDGRAAVLPGPGPLDWLYTADAAAGLLAVLEARGLAGRVFNLGAGRSWQVSDWAERLAGRLPGFRWRFAAAPQEATIPYMVQGRPPLATDRLRQATGFAATHGLDEAFADYLGWLETHRVPT